MTDPLYPLGLIFVFFSPELADPTLIIDPITEERASRTLYRIELLRRIREQVLPHPMLEERLLLCQPSPELPAWWEPGRHDKDLLRGAAKHGVSRTDYHILNDPELSFAEAHRRFSQPPGSSLSTPGQNTPSSQPKEEQLETPKDEEQAEPMANASKAEKSDSEQEEVKEEEKSAAASPKEEVKEEKEAEIKEEKMDEVSIEKWEEDEKSAPDEDSKEKPLPEQPTEELIGCEEKQNPVAELQRVESGAEEKVKSKSASENMVEEEEEEKIDDKSERSSPTDGQSMNV